MTLQFPEKIANYRRLPCLDGLRCLSVLLVLIAHSRDVIHYPASKLDPLVRWIPPGTTGVQVFFVLSGFLITFLLLKEKLKYGTISLRLFYIRRALRILPAYIAFLIVVAIIQALGPLEIHGTSWFALIAYLVNFIETPKIAEHVWSLSVEEQFYLLWPFLFWYFLVKNEGPARALIILLLPILFAPISRHLGSPDPDAVLFGEFSFFSHFDSLAFGCLLAFAFAYRGKWVETWMENQKWPTFTAALCLVYLPHLLIVTGSAAALTIPFASTLSAAGISLIIAFVLFHPTTPAVAWLSCKPIALIGVWSYSIYLWQQIFCTNPALLGFEQTPRFLAFPYWFVPVFATAITSYYLIEQPFLRLKNRWGNR